MLLRGRIKSLRLHGLDAGSVLDASALEAANVTASGKIDGRSVLKLNVPNGTVTFTGPVEGGSAVTINAPDGSVRFKSAAKIDEGSTVRITAHSIDLRGEVNGVETRVTATIPAAGSLEVAAVRGVATVEYRVVGRGTPNVEVGSVSPTANFRKIE